MAHFKLGVHIRPQHTTVAAMRAAWTELDRMGVDSISTWDHFYPLFGDPEGTHFECWSLLAAMACDTHQALIGPVVDAVSYRNPELLADMARTVDHISGGRVFLGLGAGNSERDHREFGYEFGTPGERLHNLRQALPRVKSRLAKLNPPPIGRVPIMIGGGGEKVTLRLTAEFADMWNGGGAPDVLRHKNQVLDDWCAKLGRDPKAIERTSNIAPGAVDRIDEYLAVGMERLHVQLDHPFDLAPVERALKLRG
ncbi:MAG TPA: LLM class F420-dependent oxidoreductase [Chloroflexota bacterium]|nr:LLM class F420-dependent oxidoreductase [Chloroflexota bacterium]